MVSPWSMVSERFSTAKPAPSLYLTLVFKNSICPSARVLLKVPECSLSDRSSRSNPRSKDAKPRVIGLAISDKCLMGATNKSMAVTKAVNSPTLVPPSALCTRATEIIADKAIAAIICVNGFMAAEAAVVFIDRRRSVSLMCIKRSACAGCAACRRMSRWAKTFSSTT